jgi:hypothetical protein
VGEGRDRIRGNNGFTGGRYYPRSEVMGGGEYARG